MGIKNFFIYIIIFSINLSGVSSNNLENISFYQLENFLINKTEFNENGVKLQYNIESNKDYELNRILGLMSDKYKIENINNKYHFYLKSNNTIEIKIWEEDNITFVESFIINKNKCMSTEDLKRELDNILSSKVRNKRYFKYYKGEISNTDNFYIDNIELKKELLKIENGYVGKETLKNGEKLSYGIMKYNTGVYLVIGTPVIFTTY
ncbi:hypothetical protein [Clostridium sp.]|uniref:hypothetical protein n=1 Tax=Clostridium sp. TaxID=1506 RepID=UPI0026DB0869|nr:hypothetical protein [Clostridium sp.]MDO5039591.1 hypothetical protein [Clostridium sp.]